VILFVAGNKGSGEVASQNSILAGSDKTAISPLDQVSSADIAVHVAYMTGLPETTSVVNHADSFNAVISTPTSSDATIAAKPQIVNTANNKSRKDIVRYTAVDGDTITNVAQKFGITSDSVRWSNALNAEKINAGKQLVLPPVNGIVYTVKQGDTADTLAQKYTANKEQLVLFNDAENGFKSGELIVIPNGTQPVARSTSGGGGFAWGGYTAVYSANGYDYGWCTWWSAKRRADIGRPVPSNLGNANTWARLAARAGYAVDGNPRAGDVAWYRTIGGLGHVGFVEQVNPDGSIWISDMNYQGVSQIGGSTPAGGWGRTSYHLVAPGQLGQYLFIH
jgi:surface antigen